MVIALNTGGLKINKNQFHLFENSFFKKYGYSPKMKQKFFTYSGISGVSSNNLINYSSGKMFLYNISFYYQGSASDISLFEIWDGTSDVHNFFRNISTTKEQIIWNFYLPLEITNLYFYLNCTGTGYVSFVCNWLEFPDQASQEEIDDFLLGSM
jgi:hypothetical protein